jgi:ribosomal protein S27E
MMCLSLEMLWPERFEKRYGFWRPYLKDVMVRYLACGDFHEGFARIRCEKCGTERILAYSSKRRYLCPSCHQKRAVAFRRKFLPVRTSVPSTCPA